MNAASDAKVTVPDTIEREITINAPIDVVWPLVSEPGWWINDGEIREHTIEPAGDQIWKVTDDGIGEFLIEEFESDQPHAVSFRWLAGEKYEGEAGQLRTLVQLTLRPVDDGTVVRVVESGFSSGTADESLRKTYEANTEGWQLELAAAKTHLEK